MRWSQRGLFASCILTGFSVFDGKCMVDSLIQTLNASFPLKCKIYLGQICCLCCYLCHCYDNLLYTDMTHTMFRSAYWRGKLASKLANQMNGLWHDSVKSVAIRWSQLPRLFRTNVISLLWQCYVALMTDGPNEVGSVESCFLLYILRN
jgi:hypothetical protein